MQDEESRLGLAHAHDDLQDLATLRPATMETRRLSWRICAGTTIILTVALTFVAAQVLLARLANGLDMDDDTLANLTIASGVGVVVWLIYLWRTVRARGRLFSFLRFIYGLAALALNPPLTLSFRLLRCTWRYLHPGPDLPNDVSIGELAYAILKDRALHLALMFYGGWEHMVHLARVAAAAIGRRTPTTGRHDGISDQTEGTDTEVLIQGHLVWELSADRHRWRRPQGTPSVTPSDGQRGGDAADPTTEPQDPSNAQPGGWSGTLQQLAIATKTTTLADKDAKGMWRLLMYREQSTARREDFVTAWAGANPWSRTLVLAVSCISAVWDGLVAAGEAETSSTECERLRQTDHDLQSGTTALEGGVTEDLRLSEALLSAAALLASSRINDTERQLNTWVSTVPAAGTDPRPVSRSSDPVHNVQKWFPSEGGITELRGHAAVTVLHALVAATEGTWDWTNFNFFVLARDGARGDDAERALLWAVVSALHALYSHSQARASFFAVEPNEDRQMTDFVAQPLRRVRVLPGSRPQVQRLAIPSDNGTPQDDYLRIESSMRQKRAGTQMRDTLCCFEIVLRDTPRRISIAHPKAHMHTTKGRKELRRFIVHRGGTLDDLPVPLAVMSGLIYGDRTQSTLVVRVGLQGWNYASTSEPLGWLDLFESQRVRERRGAEDTQGGSPGSGATSDHANTTAEPQDRHTGPGETDAGDVAASSGGGDGAQGGAARPDPDGGGSEDDDNQAASILEAAVPNTDHLGERDFKLRFLELIDESLNQRSLKPAEVALILDSLARPLARRGEMAVEDWDADTQPAPAGDTEADTQPDLPGDVEADTQLGPPGDTDTDTQLDPPGDTDVDTQLEPPEDTDVDPQLEPPGGPEPRDDDEVRDNDHDADQDLADTAAGDDADQSSHPAPGAVRPALERMPSSDLRKGMYKSAIFRVAYMAFMEGKLQAIAEIDPGHAEDIANRLGNLEELSNEWHQTITEYEQDITLEGLALRKRIADWTLKFNQEQLRREAKRQQRKSDLASAAAGGWEGGAEQGQGEDQEAHRA